MNRDEKIEIKKEQCISHETYMMASERGWDSVDESVTQSQLQTYLRDKYGINVLIDPSFDCFNLSKVLIHDIEMGVNIPVEIEPGIEFKDFTTYETCLERGLQESIKSLN